jgi:hypothetical protein
LNEIFEEHLKDIAWILFTIVISIALFHVTDILRIQLLNDVAKSISLVIEKHADLSAEYGGEFTISIPSTPLFQCSILLNDNEYHILIEGVCVFKGEGKYKFNRIMLEPGKTYLIKTLNNGVVLTER